MSVMIVTGGGRGIGAAIARKAGAEGWDVAVNYSRSKDQAERVAAEIRSRGRKAIAVQTDVSIEADVERMYDEIDESLGPVTALINNAAIGHEVEVADVELHDLERVLAVNVIGPWLCTRASLRRMSTRRGGSGGVIINISSVGARTGGGAKDVPYVCSKGALDAFTLGLAKEVGGEGIRVVSVHPGITRTEIFDDYEGGLESAERMARRITAIGRIAEPEEVAGLAVWLCSPDASYITATTYDVSGGR